MSAISNEDVLRNIQDNGVKFVRLWFTDVLGFLKAVSLSAKQLETALDEGMGFDGSSIEGFARIEESDLIAIPDPSTFKVLPWGETDAPVARMFCDIRKPDGQPYEGDPRWVLRKMLEKAKALGYEFFIGPELEYFYFKSSDGEPQVLDRGGYFDLTQFDVATGLRRDTVLALEKLGMDVEYSHHEVAPSQHEIDLRYAGALFMADSTMTYRLTVREIAMKHGYYATFMPKPIMGENGSGMHVHQSLFKGDKNAFYDPDDREYRLSSTARHYMAGLLRYAAEMSSVVSQWVNSYKRLVPGYEAPVYISWGHRNRSALLRVPMSRPDKPKSVRVEYRSPDPACNPYLAFAVMLAAGLKGIEEGYELPSPIEEDIFKMTPEKRTELGIESLPGSLGHAVALTEKSDLIREALGTHIFDKFIENKKIEWDRYRSHVSKYEIDTYLPLM